MKFFRNREAVQRVIEFSKFINRMAWEPFFRNEPGFPRDSRAYGVIKDERGGVISDVPSAFNYVEGLWIRLIQGLAYAVLPERPALSRPPQGFPVTDASNGWLQFELELLAEILSSETVTSVADAAVKATAHLRAQDREVRNRWLFRGQVDHTWPLNPRLVRQAKESTPPISPQGFAAFELAALREFQASVADSQQVDALDKQMLAALPLDDGQWWFHMQHYGVTKGTRLLDVSSSFLTALLFACTTFQGEINASVDGIVYLFSEGGTFVVEDYAAGNAMSRRAPEFFRVRDAVNVCHLVLNAPGNERLKAQMGGFIWAPDPFQPIPAKAYLIVPGAFKKSIARELLALGIGHRLVVKGVSGDEAESRLRAQLWP